jgi:hypothetical protein
MRQCGEALLQSQSVGRPDGKHSNATLCAACATQQVRAAAFRRVGKGAVDEHNESTVLAAVTCLGMIRAGNGVDGHSFIEGQIRARFGTREEPADFRRDVALSRWQWSGKANGAFGRRLRA